MSVERNRATFLRFYDALSRHDLDAMAECLAEDYHYHGSTGGAEERDRKAFLEFLQAMFQAFPDARIDVVDTVAEGDLVAARLRLSGTHHGELMGIPASGREMDLEFANLTRFDSNGLMLEDRDYQDMLAFMQQLGADPAAAPN